MLARGRKLRDHSTRELRALFDVIDDDRERFFDGEGIYRRPGGAGR